MSAWDLFRKVMVPLAAIVFLTFAITHALRSQRSEPVASPPVTPATSPFGNTVAGTGCVEPSTESSTQATISVGSQLAGVVTEVAVHIDQVVQQGDLLFQLDSRQAAAALKICQAAVANAKAQLNKLELQPRPEEVPALEAKVRLDEANLTELTDVRDRDRKLAVSREITQQELVAAELAVKSAQAQVEVSRANLALLKAGAWKPDKVIAAAAVEQAEAQLEQAQTILNLLQVRAPVSGSILQINVRPGEFVSSSPTQSLIVMGNIRPLHVRISIDEEDIPRLQLNAPARGKLRGDPQQREIPMQFVRIEPYVIPKVSLTGINIEKVDTRVMQLIYSIDPEHPLVKEKKVLVGQLLDVFIEAK
ncbi:MAG TPA: HlyD family efflux transporter periplasmic adaptor subunit [Pirellulales bacterium]|nr:HlyD family efflux transporter periplasmic adaptor subunit [Pirellulales bacterium]